MSQHKITPCLLFDQDAEQAIEFYSSVFRGDVAVIERTDWPEGAGGTGLLTATIELAGQRLMLLNGSDVPRTDAFSLAVDCDDAAEVDYYWDALLADGGTPSVCGWLKDRFGLSWQVVPRQLTEYLADPDREKASRVMQAMLQMTKIEVAELDAAAAAA